MYTNTKYDASCTASLRIVQAKGPLDLKYVSHHIDPMLTFSFLAKCQNLFSPFVLTSKCKNENEKSYVMFKNMLISAITIEVKNVLLLLIHYYFNIEIACKYPKKNHKKLIAHV